MRGILNLIRKIPKWITFFFILLILWVPVSIVKDKQAKSRGDSIMEFIVKYKAKTGHWPKSLKVLRDAGYPAPSGSFLISEFNYELINDVPHLSYQQSDGTFFICERTLHVREWNCHD